MSRRYDFVLFGATGFTGRLTALYLAQHAPPQARWALAGRSADKLKKILAEVSARQPAGATPVEVVVANVQDAQALRTVAESARVIVTTVGPYILHGEPLVAACAAAGTHYLDLTGEPEFVDTMWMRHHDEAARTGAKLVHACGFDSIPHDLGAYFTVQQLPRNVPIRMHAYVSARGTFSAGTFHSAVHAMSRMRSMARAAHERTRAEMERAAKGAESAAGAGKRRVAATPEGLHRPRALPGWWALPMPTIDPQIVKRSARALDVYGPDFRYGHYLGLPKLRQVLGLSVGLGALLLMSQVPPLKNWLLSRKASGEGPDEARRAKSSFCVTFDAEGGGRRVLARVTGGDPGYGETSKMLAESTLCLAFDELPAVAGQVTTVQAMGDALLRRLQAAGIGFEVVKA